MPVGYTLPKNLTSFWQFALENMPKCPKKESLNIINECLYPQATNSNQQPQQQFIYLNYLWLQGVIVNISCDWSEDPLKNAHWNWKFSTPSPAPGGACGTTTSSPKTPTSTTGVWEGYPTGCRDRSGFTEHLVELIIPNLRCPDF